MLKVLPVCVCSVRNNRSNCCRCSLSLSHSPSPFCSLFQPQILSPYQNLRSESRRCETNHSQTRAKNRSPRQPPKTNNPRPRSTTTFVTAADHEPLTTTSNSSRDFDFQSKLPESSKTSSTVAPCCCAPSWFLLPAIPLSFCQVPCDPTRLVFSSSSRNPTPAAAVFTRTEPYFLPLDPNFNSLRSARQLIGSTNSITGHRRSCSSAQKPGASSQPRQET